MVSTNTIESAPPWEPPHEPGIITVEEARWLNDRVNQGLKPTITVYDWLEKQGHLRDLEGCTTEMRKQQIQAFRHRWLKHLCEEYENARSLR